MSEKIQDDNIVIDVDHCDPNDVDDAACSDTDMTEGDMDGLDDEDEEEEEDGEEDEEDDDDEDDEENADGDDSAASGAVTDDDIVDSLVDQRGDERVKRKRRKKVKKEDKRKGRTNNPFGRGEKYSVRKIINCIQNTGGIRSAICDKLGCTRATLYNYIERYPVIKEALRDEEERVLDMAEGVLFKLVQNGDQSSVFFLLNNLGRSRGYGRREEAAKEDKPVQLVLNMGGKPAVESAQDHPQLAVEATPCVDVDAVPSSGGEAQSGATQTAEA